jgi:hypothetical protein
MIDSRLGCSTISFAHVHIRDATRGRIELQRNPIVDEPENINRSVGRGAVDFDAGIRTLQAAGSTGTTPSNSKPETSPTNNDPRWRRTPRVSSRNSSPRTADPTTTRRHP